MQDSLIYLLVYATNVDLEINNKENQFLIDFLGSKESLVEIIGGFRKDSEYERLEKVKAILSHFANIENGKVELLKSVKSVLNIDGDFSMIESSLLRLFEKYLG